MKSPRLLIAGIGNIFLGDDAFGVEVIKRLAERPLPASVRVVDFGIRGFDLAYALLDAYDSVIWIDASPRGGQPGELYLIEPDLSQVEPATSQPFGAPIEGHRMDPLSVLRFVSALGGRVDRLLLVACEPTPLNEEDDICPGLSEPVQAAVDRAIPFIEKLIDEELRRCDDERSGVPAIRGSREPDFQIATSITSPVRSEENA